MVVPRRRIVVALTVLILLLLAAVVRDPVAAEVPDPQPEAGWGVNGTVRATAIAGDVVVVGGSFSAAVAPNGATTPRQNLAAFDRTTGALLPWRADANYTVRALTTDGTTVWVGGEFTRIGDVSVQRGARLDPVTGEVDRSFVLGADRVVYALDVRGSQLFVGGSFIALRGARHVRVAQVDAATGEPSSQFRGIANAPVLGVAASPTSDVLYLAGQFSRLNGVDRAGIGAVSATTGATTGPSFSRSVRPSLGVDVSDDGSRIFGAGGGQANSISAWTTGDGARRWAMTAMGDVQAVRYYDGDVYFGFHEGFRNDTSVRLLVADAVSGALDNSFRPSFNQFWGVRAIDATAGGVVAGGQFTWVSGTRANYYVRFMP
ncbi:hypothetical protein E8D34_18510 [Nocardioides sp. GY 10113]|uniref:hypothetical protein n=1 Tax=Nocardioides sp. GY 10113 TaxID=2569761 RepID=UPI0010A91FC0|nr:hypothetical protein [Nocardioides sp. GY 10113]TIC80649.1 hypothetical protein E8D34_18510 [Nocardioides sp. GY 10113]